MTGGAAPAPLGRVGRAALVAFFAERGEPPYRADQVEEAVYVRRAASFRQISNLPIPLREALAAAFSLDRPRVVDRARADDGTEKAVIEFADGARVEAVRMPRGDRLTLCLSTQVGCRFRCAFCATGLMGLGRNLGGGEIVEEFLAVAGEERPTNVVFMGMGEPLDNIDALLEALRLMTHPKRLALSRERITVSTVGLVPAIDRLAAEGPGVRLAISLNAADDETRTKLVPVNRRWPIGEVVAAGLRYMERARARVSFEYVLLGGVNDRPEDAQALARLLGRAKVRLNVIPWNPVDGMAFTASNRVEAFVERLRPRIYAVTVRRSQGREIRAACGQLVLGRAAA